MAEEKRRCPHCQSDLHAWEGAPETGWGDILICTNNCCQFFLESKDSIEKQGGSHTGYRYAENPDNDYAGFAVASWISDEIIRSCRK